MLAHQKWKTLLRGAFFVLLVGLHVEKFGVKVGETRKEKMDEKILIFEKMGEAGLMDGRLREGKQRLKRKHNYSLQFYLFEKRPR